MASQKLIKGILGVLDEKLGTGLLKAEGRSLARSNIERTGVPVKGIMAKEPLPETVHPDVTLRTDEPLQRMFHASNSRSSFDRPTGDLNDVGLHLTRSPDIADMFSMGFDPRDPKLLNKGISLSGPRVYPMLVDPGRALKEFPADPRNWNDPQEIASMMDQEVLGKWASYPDGYDDPAMKEVRDRLGRGEGFKDALSRTGFDSAEYKITSPYSQNLEDALLLLDPSRAVPEYSQIAQKAAKTRGVLSAEKGTPMTAEEVAMQLRDITGTFEEPSDPSKFISEVFHPSKERLQGQINRIRSDFKNKKIGPQSTPFYKAKIEEIRKYMKDLGYK